jgi:type IV pilus biogenesis/stability protein PilW
MRKRKMFAWMLSSLLVFTLISCAAGLEKRKQQSKVTRELGEAYMHQGNYTDALKELLKAEALYPNDHLLQNDLGLAYMAKKRFENAKNSFKKAIELKPEYAPAKNNLGTVFLALEEWDTAIDIFEEVLGDLLYATPHYPLSNLGLAYYHKGAFRRAEAYYSKALEIDPDFVLALHGLGKTYLALNDNIAAISSFEKAIQKAPKFTELYLDIGTAYQQSKQYKSALFAYRKVLELEPGSQLAEKAGKEIKKLERLSE